MAHPHCWAVVMAALMLLVLLAGAPTTAPVPTPPPSTWVVGEVHHIDASRALLSSGRPKSVD